MIGGLEDDLFSVLEGITMKTDSVPALRTSSVVFSVISRRVHYMKVFG